MIDTRFIRQVGWFKWAIRYATLQFRKRVLKVDGRMRLPTGAELILPRTSRSATEVYVTNAQSDWGAEAIFARFADRRRDFFDIGAHIGYYANYLSPLVRRVYAFEPDPRNLPGLRANAALCANVEVLEMAVSSRDGIAKLYTGGDSSVSSLREKNAGPSISVPITTIDAFVRAQIGIDAGLIKTDIEGHDLEALRGMSDTVRRFQPLILTECNDADGLPPLCAAWDYRIFAITRDRATLKTRFEALSGPGLRERWYKMLFLVPRRLHADFTAMENRP